jgi:hypothetical protein
MTWPTVVASVQFLAAAMALWAAVVMVRWPAAPGRAPFVWTQVAIAWWATTAGLEIVIADPEWRLRVAQLQYIGITTLPVFWLHFAAQYGRRRVQEHPGLRLLWVVPSLTIAIAATHGWQHWLWTEVRLPSGPDAFVLEFVRGPWFWVNWIHAYGLLVVSTTWLFIALRRYRSHYYLQTGLFIVGVTVPWIANLATIMGWVPWPGLDLTPVAFACTGAVFALGTYCYR